MRNPFRKIIRKSNVFLNGMRQKREQGAYQVQFYNMWDGFVRDGAYWSRFLKAKGLLDSGKSVAVFSCIGPRYMMDLVHTDVKIFFTGENVKRSSLLKYADHALRNQSINLAMGFEVFEDPRYLRFPLWMDYMFQPEWTADEIRTKCEQLRFPNIQDKRKFCCMVSTNSADGLRKEMMEAISQIAHVDSGGLYMHNDDSLQTEYKDDKLAYLQSYSFNICPENTLVYGYTTEKVFEAISVGCIPIYWGADFADKDVINENAVIRWDRKDGGQSALKQIQELYANPKMLNEFLTQPRLLPTAEEYILDTFATIESKLRTIINNK